MRRSQRILALVLRKYLKHWNAVGWQDFGLPVQPQSKVRGVATAISALPMSDKIVSEKEAYVWPDAKGNLRGESIVPLYRTVPMAVQNDSMLHSLLAIADVFRIGRTREVEIAKDELNSILATYDVR